MISRRLSYILAAILLFFSTRTTVPSRSLVFQLGTLAILFIIFNRKRFKFDKTFLYYNSIILLLFAVYTFYFLSVNPIFIINLVVNGNIAYLILKMIGYKFFDNFIDIVYKLALISLPLFVIQQFYFEQLFSINNVIESAIPSWDIGDSYTSSSVIYTMKGNVPERNSGFMWEPGAYAAYLLFAIYLNLIKNKLRIDRKSIIMTLAMITTFSTMGYIGLLVLAVYYSIVKKITRMIFLLPILIPLMIFVSSLNFMQDKVETEYRNIDKTIKTVQSSKVINNQRTSLGRMASLKMDISDMLKYPVFGIGGEHEAKTQSSYTVMGRTSGIGNYILTFGLFGVLMFFYNYKKSFNKIHIYYNAPFPIMGIIIILIFMFSNHLLTQSIFLGLHLFHTLELKKHG